MVCNGNKDKKKAEIWRFFLRIKYFALYLHLEKGTNSPDSLMLVRWMSGLVTGLQNRLQRFESASDLTKTALETLLTLFLFCFVRYLYGILSILSYLPYKLHTIYIR